MAENVYGPQEPSLVEVTQAAPCAGGVDGAVEGGLEGLAGVLGLALPVVVGVGCGWPADGPDRALHWTSDEPRAHWGALVDTWGRRPPARQAEMVRLCPAPLCTLAASASWLLVDEWVPATA